ncbi:MULTISPECIES: metallophosphoesterase [Clostridium]|uniref:Metallophosphoesterase n=1 Tax=Clostridium aquiflavi TaxID=3073603 RepID=A0ABU1EGD8_9CLOT|nr:MULTISPECIES: metallophosphoesterase [unclassified Clostridium]MDR5587451.1 metallophosphoesterase [Clostridium sp. 5N-1]NFG63053.1 phosphoesterase [Clostridium botulinum]NFQ08664.1 phosphoesterase [Clostridium botulinum]
MKKIFFIGDTHFGDSQIIDYEQRPFANVEEMDIELINRWNSVVTDDDTVFMIGDFSLYPKEKTTEICNKLKGQKILIVGNHDSNSEEYYYECGFKKVYQYPIILDEFWMISHKPLYLNKNMPYANIYGHVHGNEMYVDYSKQSFCACVERINYTPISWEQIKEKMNLFS